SGPCGEACDVNGTGALNLGDVITTLSVVFGPTVTPPPPPYPTCGSPPGSGPFNCDSFSSCP
ncbi:MAG: hypothetical protein ACE5GW_13120, partial [Planctomycetota bacterium]